MNISDVIKKLNVGYAVEKRDGLYKGADDVSVTKLKHLMKIKDRLQTEYAPDKMFLIVNCREFDRLLCMDKVNCFFLAGNLDGCSGSLFGMCVYVVNSGSAVVCVDRGHVIGYQAIQIKRPWYSELMEGLAELGNELLK